MAEKTSQVCWLILITLMVGCGDSTPDLIPAASKQSEEVNVAEALPESMANELSVSELRGRLKANQNAEFVKRNGQIVMAKLINSGVTDLSPLKGLPLIQLEIDQLAIKDLSPLKGMPLKNLFLMDTLVTDLSPLAGMDFETLWLEGCPISDLSPAKDFTAIKLNLSRTKVSSIEALAGKTFDTLWLPYTEVTDLSPLPEIKLVSLDIEGTPVTDLSPLVGHDELLRLNIAGVRVSDLSALKDLKIERLVFSPELCQESWEIIKGMKSIQQIGPSLEKLQSPAEFWGAPQWEK